MGSLDTRSVGVFDYAVLGGGTAGLVVAARLTEDPNVSVLVLEAGEDRLGDPRISIPGMARRTQHNPELSWHFWTEPQPGLNDRKIVVPQGKLLGGSSGINNQAWIAPSAAGIDAWEELGNQGWNWKTLAPYYRKAFHRTIPDKETAEGLGIGYLDADGKDSRENGGPLEVSFSGRLDNPVAVAWVDTFKSLGWADAKNDPFDGKYLGGYQNPSSVSAKAKTRTYSHSAYLNPIKSRPNLMVQTGALVSKIIFAPNNVSDQALAEQVEFLADGQTKTAQITKEVVLAAGALSTPKILELSGVGDPVVLREHGIDVVVENNGVGTNLQDRLMTGISFEVKEGIETLDDFVREKPGVVERAQELYKQGRGTMAIGGITLYGGMPFKATEVEGQTPLEPLVNGADLDSKTEFYGRAIKKIVDANECTGGYWISPIQWPLRGQIQEGSYVTIGTNQCYPFTRGTVHISSSDPTAMPIVDPTYLKNDLDMEFFARQVFWLQTLGQTSPMADLFKPDGRRNHELAWFKTVEDAKGYIRETATTEYHPCGSCAMLPKEHGGAVSSELKVYGTKNVRVVDSSMMPMITDSNLQPTVYAVAERAVDLIRGRG